jgi:hypothetical protein
MFGTKFIRIRKSPWGKLSGFDVEKPWFWSENRLSSGGLSASVSCALDSSSYHDWVAIASRGHCNYLASVRVVNLKLQEDSSRPLIFWESK